MRMMQILLDPPSPPPRAARRQSETKLRYNLIRPTGNVDRIGWDNPST